MSSEAHWRDPAAQRTHWDVMAEIIRKGKQVSPRFAVPGMSSEICRIDWLHVADQGITADYLGHLFLLLAPKLGGNNKKEHVQRLWHRLQLFHDRDNVEDRLSNLTHTMLVQNKKSPKLRCSAAQCRALVPFALELSQELLVENDAVEAAAKAGMWH